MFVSAVATNEFVRDTIQRQQYNKTQKQVSWVNETPQQYKQSLESVRNTY